jgi:hypothetical protein
MNRVIDLVALWFLGLTIGSASSGILSNPKDKFLPQSTGESSFI